MASNSRWSSFGGRGGGRRRYEDPFASFAADEARREAQAKAAREEAVRAAAAAAAFEAAKVQALKDWQATGIIKYECGMVLPEYREIAKRLIEEQDERERPQREAVWAEQARKRAEYEASVIAECRAEEREAK
jgi:hypothetical protein